MSNKVFSALIVSSILVSFTIGACTKKTEEPKTGLAAAQENVQKTPSFENHIALGLEYANSGFPDKALEAYTRAKELNPQSPLAWNNLCATYNSLGKIDLALPNCEKAVELEPNFVLARNNLEWTRKMVKEGTGGANLVERKKTLLAKKNATSAEYLALGFDFYNAKDHPTAIEIWSLVKAGDPEYSKALNNIATSNIITGNFDKAEKAITLALTLEPTNQLYINNRKWLEDAKAAKAKDGK